MDFNSYQRAAHETAIYPQEKALEYLTLGLNGESGEVANKVKKLIRDEDTAAKRQAAIAELGDVLWYVSELCTVCGVELAEVAHANLRKLADRKGRRALGGSGDDR